MNKMLTIPPKAREIPHKLSAHGQERIDPYYWMRDRENPEVIAYLEAENEYLKQNLAHTETLKSDLFEEIIGRIKQEDQSVPYQLKDYFYYSRFEKGQEYPIYCRRFQNLDAPEEITLNVNELAKDATYCHVSGVSISPSQQLMLFGVDTIGRRIYELRFKNLATGEALPDVIPAVTGNAVWADEQTIFYSRQDPKTLRSYQIYRHQLGTDSAEDVLVFEEPDETYRAYISRSKSREFLFIICDSTLRTEIRFLRTDDHQAEPTILLPREGKHEYSVDHLGDHFYILTNWEAENFRLMRCPTTHTDKAHWEEVIPHRKDTLLEDVELFRDFLVIQERTEGLNQICVRPWGDAASYYIEYRDPSYSAYTAFNPELDTHELRYGYESLTTPRSTYALDMRTGETQLLKQQEILGGFEVENYRSERSFATAEDGTKVPISLVYHKDTPIDGTAPLLLYGYGSYGYSLDPFFSPARLSLLERGFVYAIGHVRGGEEMGRFWYEQGRLLQKKNSFTDFIACGEHLIQSHYTGPGKLFVSGGSAGGLLVGAAVNMRPDLFEGVVAAVPFVDVVTTMMDDSIPLTTGEYDEWGNPNDPTYHEYMLSYSPYDNIKEIEYPHMLITSGLHDSQVQYWEPTKWVARLRALKKGENKLFLYTNMEAGHSGASGRFESYKEVVLQYAFLLDLVGINR